MNIIPWVYTPRDPAVVVPGFGFLHFDAEVFAGPILVLRTAKVPSVYTSSLNREATGSGPDGRQYAIPGMERTWHGARNRDWCRSSRPVSPCGRSASYGCPFTRPGPAPI